MKTLACDQIEATKATQIRVRIAKDIVDAVQNYKPDNSRSQEIITDNNRVLMDAYNANPMNMKAALNSFTQTFQSNRTMS